MHLPLLKWATLRHALTQSTRQPLPSGARPSTCRPTLCMWYYPRGNVCLSFSDIRDIHSPLEVSVYIEKNKPELLGRIKIPLLRVSFILSCLLAGLP